MWFKNECRSKMKICNFWLRWLCLQFELELFSGIHLLCCFPITKYVFIFFNLFSGEEKTAPTQEATEEFLTGFCVQLAERIVDDRVRELKNEQVSLIFPVFYSVLKINILFLFNNLLKIRNELQALILPKRRRCRQNWPKLCIGTNFRAKFCFSMLYNALWPTMPAALTRWLM